MIGTKQTTTPEEAEHRRIKLHALYALNRVLGHANMFAPDPGLYASARIEKRKRARKAARTARKAARR